MSNPVSKISLDEEATSRTSSKAFQPSWMSHWTRKNCEVASKVNDPSLVQVCHKDRVDDSGRKSDASTSKLSMVNGFSRYGKSVIEAPKEMLFGMRNETNKPVDFKCETGDLEFGTKDLSLALALGRSDTSTDLNLRNESMLRPNEKHCVSKYCAQNKAGSTFSLPTYVSKKADTSRPVVVFEKHFSNDNFTCFCKDTRKQQKYSSLLVHEADMKNDLTYEAKQNVDTLPLQYGQSENMKFKAFFGRKHSMNVPHRHSGRLLPTYPGDHGKSRLSENVSVRNVETMRICTMVDSVENSPEGYHKISQRAHHVLFTKETCANLHDHCDDNTFAPFNVSHGFPPSRPSAVKIQPLWTSTEGTDSEEKENTGNSSVFKAGSRNEVSIETESRQQNAPHTRHELSEKTSSPSRKDNTVDEISSLAAYDSKKTEKTRTKRPPLEFPDINEELPGVKFQLGISSADYEQPSTSRVHSLNANHLFPNKKQALNHPCKDSQDHSSSPETSIKCPNPDPGNRWIKRLKRSSSDSVGVGTKSVGVGTKSSHEEDSSNKKFNMFFNKITKSSEDSLDPKLLKRHGKEHVDPEQKSESIVSKRDHSTMNGCSWIQRWCQNISRPKNPEPNVICEPHSLKVGQDNLVKKQFPSIGALALMGKAMNGYRSCEFSKKGSVVVWNTREF